DDTVTDEVKVEYLLARAFPARVTIRNNGATRPARAPDVVRRGGAGNVLEVAPKVYYGVVHLIDHGATGTGHQVAVTKFLDGLAQGDYQGTIHLIFLRNKSRFYALKLGRARDLEDPVRSHALYHGDWDGTYKGLNIRCHPRGKGVQEFVPNALQAADKRLVAGDFEACWKTIAWPGAPGPSEAQIDGVRGLDDKRAWRQRVTFCSDACKDLFRVAHPDQAYRFPGPVAGPPAGGAPPPGGGPPPPPGAGPPPPPGAGPPPPPGAGPPPPPGAGPPSPPGAGPPPPPGAVGPPPPPGAGAGAAPAAPIRTTCLQCNGSLRALLAFQEAFRNQVNASEVAETTVSPDEIRAEDTSFFTPPAGDPGAVPAPDKALCAFAAMDGEPPNPDAPGATYFEQAWLALAKDLTGDDSPYTVILQPFLWEKHPMQVLRGGEVKYDIGQAMTRDNIVPSYAWEPPWGKGNQPNIDSLVDATPATMHPPGDKTEIKTILQHAGNGSLLLMPVYFTQASSAIPYDDVLRVLIKVIAAVRAQLAKPVVLALFGGELPNAHVDAKAWADTKNIARVSLVPIGDRARATGAPSLNPADFAGANPSIYLAHVGRSATMPVFEHFAHFFITEGANTWQEILTLGTPGLSTKPTGDTKPWERSLTAGDQPARDLVRDASVELAGGVANVLKDDWDPARSAICRLLLDLNTPGSTVRPYFDAWRQAMARSDQFLKAVELLKDEDVILFRRHL
ncbi:MAG: hypothetical protein PVF51_08615, partial [Nitrospirota bacterium]